MSDVKAVINLVAKFELLKAEIEKVIIGQKEAVNFTLLSIICGGHSLLIGVPGLAKTLLVMSNIILLNPVYWHYFGPGQVWWIIKLKFSSLIHYIINSLVFAKYV